MTESPDKVRVDKWLWSVRIFKTRSRAGEACKSNKVKVNGEIAKPSTSLQVDDRVGVRKDGFDLEFKVLQLIEKRVSAPLAQACYQDLTPEEELQKFQDWYVGKSGKEFRERGAGRPTKKERRTIERFKWEQYDGDDHA
jgi:ribosome-associated heat shock protein Hsp15